MPLPTAPSAWTHESDGGPRLSVKSIVSGMRIVGGQATPAMILFTVSSTHCAVRRWSMWMLVRGGCAGAPNLMVPSHRLDKPQSLMPRGLMIPRPRAGSKSSPRPLHGSPASVGPGITWPDRQVPTPNTKTASPSYRSRDHDLASRSASQRPAQALASHDQVRPGSRRLAGPPGHHPRPGLGRYFAKGGQVGSVVTHERKQRARVSAAGRRKSLRRGGLRRQAVKALLPPGC